ncbi:four helix bundle protein [Pelovirga terrestris]|uniref:Four helix bundle protein n=1 Tax=Pelovirga terrestris TaxID=2771352 RepID=A0A8J6QXC7_9BACT|nr:four helix bundle protein [Pelovirga terrestris]MBD1400683.1 four helix bundle protein [Pelovirga terrestris]
MDIRPHRKLDVWQKSMQLTKDIYEITTSFPRSEVYGLSSQMRRAATSIPSNIAEGAGRRGNKEFLQFIGIAQGSASELDTQLELATMVGYIDKATGENLAQKLNDLTKMLYGLSRALHPERP